MATFSGTTLNDTLFGSALSDLLLGLGGNDMLSGGSRADTLDGGTGADTLEGGNGNDTYVVDSATDVIHEDEFFNANDRVLASIAIDLTSAAYFGIEHVTLTGTTALNATGDEFANMLIGNVAANVLDGNNAGSDTLIGGAGNDSYKVGSQFDVVIEYAGEGTDLVTSSASAYTLGAFVENLTLAADGGTSSGTGNAVANAIAGNAFDNKLLGLAGNDTLTGNDGNDTLDGGIGADSLTGGNGDDLYVVDNVGDKAVESSITGGTDKVESSITFVLGANLENLTLTGLSAIDGTGNTLNNIIDGNTKDNVLIGLAGNDTLSGHGGGDMLLGGDGNDTLEHEFGVTTLVGGGGNDSFRLISDAGQAVIRDFNGLPNTDKIDMSSLFSSVTVDDTNIDQFLQVTTANGSTTINVDVDGTGTFVDPLCVLQGVSTDLAGLLANGAIVGVNVATVPAISGSANNDSKLGTANSDLILGLAGSDTLTGGDGADTLDGGIGTDKLDGGTGNDTYVVDSATDVIVETGGDKDDRILASIAINLTSAAYVGIEHVTLTGTTALNATGDEFANMLIGNAAANVLDGGVNSDTLIGGAGNDTFIVDSGQDQVVENAGEGTDLVKSSALSYTLGAFVENLTLLEGGNFSGTGNALANVITGNTGDNVLDGGAGADILTGGNGNDTYIVDNVGDKVVESSTTGGTDKVESSITYVLGTNLENLALIGASAINGTGNTLNNEIEGNSAANLLSGLAGNDTLIAGGDADTLVGGLGNDSFKFDGSSLAGVDAILDFNGLPNTDKIDFSSSLFSVLVDNTNIDDFLRAVTADGNTTIQIDADGTANGVNFVDMGVLQGVSTDLDGLLANGAIAIDGVAVTSPTSITGTTGNDSLPVGSPPATSTLILGLGGNDTLTGGGGDDTLDGGTGTDNMVGGAGNDTYVVDSATDKITDSGGSDDRILASIAINLTNPLYDGVEHVTLTGTTALNATGDEFANMLIGNGGANVLDGGLNTDTLVGDTLIGGAGNDTYVVHSAFDVVIENAGEGTDLVKSSADSFTLGANIENLTLLEGGDFSGTGNALVNVITGNSGSNVLDGGAGADSLTGGNGDDIYFVDNVGDKVVESSATGGQDAVESTITYTLGVNLEDLGLDGADNIDGTGNTLGNTISGNDGDNVLSGLAGNDTLDGGLGGNDLLLGGDGNDLLFATEGTDTLAGGAGSDTFHFESFSLDGRDVIADFNGLPGGDLIDISQLLTGFNPDSSNINDFVKTTQTEGSTTIQVDVDGTANGANFVDMAVLQGVCTDVMGLLNNGSLVLATDA